MTKIVIIEDIKKYNKMYDENSKLNGISFKDDINYIVQFTQFQLQFTILSLIIKKYSPNVKIELFKENILRTENNIHQRQNQFITYFLFMNDIDYSFAK